MKKKLLNFIVGSVLSLTACNLQAQFISNFDDLTLGENSNFKGANIGVDTSFISGNASYYNKYSMGYWMHGWAYSNLLDTTTLDYTNLYGARTGKAYDGKNYAIGQQNAVINFVGDAMGKIPTGIYITNTTYAYGSMSQGDFAKKFGGVAGNDPDFFKLTISSYFNGKLKESAVDFYLADFRNENNSKDYILKDWTFVDLSSLGNTDSLLFNLSSSDFDEFGFKTPLFFAIDKLTLSTSVTNIEDLNSMQLQVLPNPANEKVFVHLKNSVGFSTVKVTDLQGNVLKQEIINQVSEGIDIAALPEGMYLVTVQCGDQLFTKKLIKK